MAVDNIATLDGVGQDFRTGTKEVQRQVNGRLESRPFTVSASSDSLAKSGPQADVYRLSQYAQRYSRHVASSSVQEQCSARGRVHGPEAQFADELAILVRRRVGSRQQALSEEDGIGAREKA